MDIVEKLKTNGKLTEEDIQDLPRLEKLFGKQAVYEMLMAIDQDEALDYFNCNFYTCEGEIYEIPSGNDI